jgi:transcriptional regulator with XRE-family HTH domain
MPRPNKPRTVRGEDHLAARITLEREARGWSMDGLARRMTDAGCAISASAVHKIERGEPRRKITVDELLAFADVFGIPMNELVIDPDASAAGQVADLLDEVARINGELARTLAELRTLTNASPAAEKALRERTGGAFIPEWRGTPKKARRP